MKMTTILEKLIKKEPITDKDTENQLLEMCEREHSSCNNECLIYAKCCPKDKHNKKHWECPFFKSPNKMLIELRKKIKDMEE